MHLPLQSRLKAFGGSILYFRFCFDFLVVADEFIKALSFIKLLSDSDCLEIGNANSCFPLKKETDIP